MDMKDVNKLPAAIVPIESRSGFTFCSDCRYCIVFDEKTVKSWAGKMDLFGSYVKRAPTASPGNNQCSFPVVTISGGCFEGKRLTKEEITASRLAEK